MTDSVEFRLILRDEFSKAMGDFKTKLHGADTQIGETNSLLKELKSTIIAAFGVYEIIQFGKEILNTTVNFQSYDNMIKFASKNAKDYATNQAFINSEVKNLSLPLEETKEGFAELANGMYGTGIEGQKLRDLFDGVNEAAAALHLPADKYSQAMYAMKEIGEYGTVHARQMMMLSFDIPGTMSLAAKAMHMSMAQFHEEMRKGTINSGQFLTNFSAALKDRFSSGVERFKESLLGQMNALKNKSTELMLSIGNTLQPVIIRIIHALSGMMDIIRKVGHAIKETVHWFKEHATVTKILLAIIIPLTAALVAYQTYVGLVSMATKIWAAVQWALNAAMDANPIGLIIAAITACIAAVIYAWYHFNRFRGIILGLWETIKGAGVALVDFAKGLGNAILSAWDLIHGNLAKAKADLKESMADMGKMVDDFKAGLKKGAIAYINATTQKTSSNPAKKLKDAKDGMTGDTEGKTGGGTGEGNQTDKVTGQKSVTINVSINKLVETIKIMSQTVKEGADMSGEHVVKALLAATNQFSASADI